MQKCNNPIKVIAGFYGVTPEDILGASRKSSIMEARKISVWYLYNILKLDYDFIYYIIKTPKKNMRLYNSDITNQLEVDKVLKNKVEGLINLLK